MFIKGDVELVVGLAGVVFIGFFLLLLWIAFAETLKTYIDRTKELELERRKDSVFVRFGRNTAGLVHNLRNMLTVAYGFNDLIGKEVESDYVKNLVEREHAAFDRMSGTIARTLAIVKAKQETSTKPVDLNELVAGLMDFLSTDLKFKHDVQPKLKLTDSKLIVSVQPLELCEVIENLIRNSWEAMSSKERETPNVIEIETFAAPTIGFIVRDNGPGFPGLTSCANEECRRYFRIGQTTKEHGTGLGVAFVLEAAQSNGWDIEIASNPGGGFETRIQLNPQGRADK